MALPFGAASKLTGAVQAAQVASALSDWQTLLPVCSVSEGINDGADERAFVRGLDLAKTEVTLSDGTTQTPWRHFRLNQTPGAEELWLWANGPSISAAADTEFCVYSGCDPAQIVGEDSGAGVVSAETQLYTGMDALGTDWTANHLLSGNGSISTVEGVIGQAQNWVRSDENYIEITPAAGMAPFPMTMSVWLKQADSGFYDVAIEIANADGGLYLRLQNAVGDDWQAYRNIVGESEQLRHYDAVDTGVWHHHCVTIQDGEMRYYIDASEDEPAGANVSGYTGAEVALLGRYAGGAAWGGAMDEVICAQAAWSSDDVQTYHAMTSRPDLWCVSLGVEEAAGAAWPWHTPGFNAGLNSRL